MIPFTFLLFLGIFIWIDLSQSPTLSTFFVGSVLSFCILALFASFFGVERTLKRWIYAFVFLVKFGIELIKSNLTIAKAVLTKENSDIQPGFLQYPIAHLTDLELFLLSHCITLTPGTSSCDITEDRSTLIIHAFDAHNPEAVCVAIRNALEDKILRFTR